LHERIVCHFLISLFLFSCSISVSLYFMADVPAAKRVRRAIGTVCDACGKQFASSYAFDKHRTCVYLKGTPCYVIDDGSTRTNLVATERVTMSTAMLQKLKVARRKHGRVPTWVPVNIWCLCCLFYIDYLGLNPSELPEG
jgi:hypothetical protein